MSKKRNLKPRATESLVVAPATVTDRSAPAVLGLDPRDFRVFVLRHRIPHVREGHRTVARVADVLEAIGRGGSAAEAGLEAREEDLEERTDGPDGVLRRVGLRRAGGGR